MRRRPKIKWQHALLDGVMWIVGAVGVIALFMAPVTYLDAGELRDRRESIASMPDLTQARSGERGVLDARVAEGVPPLRGGLVVYLRERYKRGWQWLEGKAQPLALHTVDDKSLTVINNDYQLDRAVEPWAATRRDESGPTFSEGAVRITGISTGDAVMIVGHRKNARTNEVVAETIAGVGRKTYLARLDGDIAAATRAALWMLPMGALCLACAVWMARRMLARMAR